MNPMTYHPGDIVVAKGIGMTNDNSNSLKGPPPATRRESHVVTDERLIASMFHDVFTSCPLCLVGMVGCAHFQQVGEGGATILTPLNGRRCEVRIFLRLGPLLGSGVRGLRARRERTAKFLPPRSCREQSVLSPLNAQPVRDSMIVERRGRMPMDAFERLLDQVDHLI